MNILVVGLSHKTAPVSIRERVAFPPTAMEKPLHEMRALPSINEAVIVSTCNRVELYATSNQPDVGIHQLKSFFASYHGMDLEELESHLYDYQGADAIRHVFRVAASLDSMVIGEPQILGQIKTSYGYAVDFKTVGLILNRFLHKAFSVAKRVRTETNIAGNAVSVSFAAVELARKIFGTLDGKKILLIGAGEMCELAARHFLNNGASSITVTNRTFDRAQKLADEFQGRALPFEEFTESLHQADIVLTSTGAPNFILTEPKVQEVIRKRKNKPMLFIDIAVPRDIDPKVNKIDNVYLYDVDDLQGVIQANLKGRQKEAKKAEQLIEQEIGKFHDWLSSLDVKPTIVQLRRRLQEIQQVELAKTFGNLQNLGAKEKKAIEAMTNAIINKVLHRPTCILKGGHGGEPGDNFVDPVRVLFDLPAISADDDMRSLETTGD